VEQLFGQNAQALAAKYTLMHKLLQGNALAYFNQSVVMHIGETAENFTLCVNELIAHLLLQCVPAEQKCYMSHFIHKPQDLSAQKFIVRLFEINKYLCMFPLFQPNQQLPLDELLDIAKFSVLATCQRTMRMHGFAPIMHDENVFVEFCERCKFNEGPVEDSHFQLGSPM